MLSVLDGKHSTRLLPPLGEAPGSSGDPSASPVPSLSAGVAPLSGAEAQGPSVPSRPPGPQRVLWLLPSTHVPQFITKGPRWLPGFLPRPAPTRSDDVRCCRQPGARVPEASGLLGVTSAALSQDSGGSQWPGNPRARVTTPDGLPTPRCTPLRRAPCAPPAPRVPRQHRLHPARTRPAGLQHRAGEAGPRGPDRVRIG